MEKKKRNGNHFNENIVFNDYSIIFPDPTGRGMPRFAIILPHNGTKAKSILRSKFFNHIDTPAPIKPVEE